MGRAPCCDKANVKKGPWSPEEDSKLKEYIEKHGIGGNWIALPQKAGLRRCGKSCRLRWLNYLRPNIKHGEFSDDEDRVICSLFASIGSRWSIIAAQLPGRTDNDIKNYWNTKLRKKLLLGTIAPFPSSSSSPPISKTHHRSLLNNMQSLLQSTTSPSSHAGSSASSSSSPPPTIYSQCSSSRTTTTNSSIYNYYLTPQEAATTRSFYCEQQPPISALSSFLNSTYISPTSAHPMQQQHHYEVKESTNALFMLGGGGGHEASCTTTSSSGRGGGGSSGGDQEISFQSYYCNTGEDHHEEEGQKFVLSSSGVDNHQHGWTHHDDHQKQNMSGLWGETEMPFMEYGLEEIKQLISSNNNSTINVCNMNNYDHHQELIKTQGVYL